MQLMTSRDFMPPVRRGTHKTVKHVGRSHTDSVVVDELLSLLSSGVGHGGCCAGEESAEDEGHRGCAGLRSKGSDIYIQRGSGEGFIW